MRSLLILFFSLIIVSLRAEGTKELEPKPGQGKTKLDIGTDRVYNFGTYTSTSDKKI